MDFCTAYTEREMKKRAFPLASERASEILFLETLFLSLSLLCPSLNLTIKHAPEVFHSVNFVVSRSSSGSRKLYSQQHTLYRDPDRSLSLMP